MKLINPITLKRDLSKFYDNEVTARQLIDNQPTINTDDFERRVMSQCLTENYCKGWNDCYDAIMKKLEGLKMSEYCYRKAVRMRIDEEEACKIFNVNDSWDIAELLKKTEFEIAPTREFFIDYNLDCSKEASGDWGRSRPLRTSELTKYQRLFSNLLKGREISVKELALVEYCWYDCSEAPDYFNESTIHDDFYDEV